MKTIFWLIAILVILGLSVMIIGLLAQVGVLLLTLGILVLGCLFIIKMSSE